MVLVPKRIHCKERGNRRVGYVKNSKEGAAEKDNENEMFREKVFEESKRGLTKIGYNRKAGPHKVEMPAHDKQKRARRAIKWCKTITELQEQ